MDIKSGKTYPSKALSNFTPHPFVFRGVDCASMEGLLQATKVKNNFEMQKHVCSLVGREAKKSGRKRNWKQTQILWWGDTAMKRDSQEYQKFLDEAFESLCTNATFRKALLATGDSNITHSIGKRKQSETCLTENEFCSRLMKLRKRINNGEVWW